MQKLHSTSQVTGGAGQALTRGREATRQRETRGAPQALPVTPHRGEKDAGEAHFPDHSWAHSVLEPSAYGGDENREVWPGTPGLIRAIKWAENSGPIFLLGLLRGQKLI